MKGQNKFNGRIGDDERIDQSAEPPGETRREPGVQWASAWLLLTATIFFGACGQGPDATPEPLKLYVFDCGALSFDDVSMFGLTNEETPVRELFVPCYLVDHPSGTLLWDAGLSPALVGQGEVTMDSGARVRYERSLLDQLDSAGHTPADVDYIALSHMHLDHSGGANLFAGSHLLIQQAEYTAAFEHAEDHPVFDPSLYDKLSDADRTVLDGDHDVFGDGRVQILSAPGHTPGHQVLFIDLENTGPLLLSGDLYHFRESRRLRRTPVFNTDAEQTLASMDRVEAFITERGATLWIEHDKALADTLDRAPAFYD